MHKNRGLFDQAGLIARLWRTSPITAAGLVLIGLVLFAALLAPLIATHDPLTLDMAGRLLPPGADHWFGTDEVGRDIFSRVIYGSRISITTGLVVVVLTAATGIAIGCYAGLVGGRADFIIQRVIEVILAVPSLVLAIALTAALGPSLSNAMIALLIVMAPGYVRLARGQALTVAQNPYVDAARVSGAGTSYILFRHIIPNSVSPVLVQATLDVGGVILAVAALSFIGLGAQPPTAEWGAMVSSGREHLLTHWWYPTFPGLAILLTAMAFNMTGDGLRDVLDPKTRSED